MIVLALIVLAIGLLIAGAEIFLVIGIPAVLAKHIFHPHMPDLIIGQRVVGGVEVVTLLAIPFFVFASDLMARGRMAAQLAVLFRALVGHYRGGIGHSTVVTCMVFGAAAGSAPATVAAMGRLSFPELKRAGFSEKFSLGLIASSAECALLIPPSITFVVYSWLTGTSIAALFAAGLVIGIVLGLAFMVLVALEAWRVEAAVGERYSGAAQWKAFRDAFWALLMQVILLVGIFSGVFTATEAAAVSVVYAIGVEVLIFRAFGWREVFDIARDSAISTGVIFILLAMGALLAFFITLSGLDRAVLALVREAGVNWVVFMMIVNVDLPHLRDVPRSQLDHGHLPADPVPGRRRARHRPGAFRHGRHAQRLHRHDHAAARARSCGRGVDAQPADGSGGRRDLAVHPDQHRGADPDQLHPAALHVPAEDFRRVARAGGTSNLQAI